MFDNIRPLGMLVSSSIFDIFEWNIECVQLSCLLFMLVYWSLILVYTHFSTVCVCAGNMMLHPQTNMI